MKFKSFFVDFFFLFTIKGFSIVPWPTHREKHIFPFLIKNWTFISTTVKWLWTYRISKLNLNNSFQNPWLHKSRRFKNSFTYFGLFLEFNSFICSNMNNYFNPSREIELKIWFQCIFFCGFSTLTPHSQSNNVKQIHINDFKTASNQCFNWNVIGNRKIPGPRHWNKSKYNDNFLGFFFGIIKKRTRRTLT